ncbi:MAG: tRNA pseudouridine(38-40) synthase TruA [Atribacterota bacterium]|jgi:tRNA pseudouridine38-40 synthase|nr:tRNA pseudouridine(38-40) synthase TruA [Atribacterota bacterium]MDD4896849.1 tRNA pseudouridine(38-40) synthase TruA [Atribacterota bacterium]MDD5636399.1 tRNA pseudouridine(38-40) synthase TruA [Atribacterota bacterium]
MHKFKNIKLTISYDGTNYSGWQRQRNKKTIQGVIEDTLRGLAGEKELKLYGAGRTDAGVHAVGQVANFKTKVNIPIDKWNIILNNLLPRDIRIKFSKEVDIKFHSRYSAKSRIYKYYLINRLRKNEIFSAKDLFLSRYCYLCNYQLDIEKMKKTAQYLLGYHDFNAFSCFNQKRGELLKNKTRYIKKINIIKKRQLITFSIEADAFLYKMTRIIVGTLIDFSIKNKEPEEILEILENSNMKNIGQVVPPNGLYLLKVKY